MREGEISFGEFDIYISKWQLKHYAHSTAELTYPNKGLFASYSKKSFFFLPFFILKLIEMT